MNRQVHLFILIVIPLLISLQTDLPSVSGEEELNRYRFESQHMGTLFRITLYAPDDSVAQIASDSAFRHVEKLNSILSDYDPDSELNRLAEQSGNGNYVTVSRPLFEVLAAAQLVSRQTDGAFDITVGPYVRLWRTIRNADEPRLPDDETLKELQKRTGYHKVLIDSTTHSAALLIKDMQLDLGGIAKGYAADVALKVLESFNIKRALVDAGGDIVTGEPPPGKDGWHISIPVNQHKKDKMKLITLVLSNRALATSGDLFQYVVIDEERYSHIIDPGTGLGLTDRSTVSVIAPDGMTADSYASAVSVLGPKEGIRFIESKPGAEVRMEYLENDSVVVGQSPGFQKLTIDIKRPIH